MKIRTFERPSDKQIEAAGNIDAARKRMLDWNLHFGGGEDAWTTHRVALGDFAVVPGQPWKHPLVALIRDLDTGAPLNGGEVGASAIMGAVGEGESQALRGMALLRHMSRRLLEACVTADPRKPADLDAARKLYAEDRQYAPTGYFAVADLAVNPRGQAKIDITQVGDVFVALDTGGRIPRVLEGSVQQRAYAGEQILGADKAIDELKGELKRWISARHPDVSDQHFYDLIFDHANLAKAERQKFRPTHKGNIGLFNAVIRGELREYACTKYAAQGLTPAIFDTMIAKGMTPWQQQTAQNNRAAGPFWYPALDPLGDTPEEGVACVRLQLDDVLRGSPVRLTMWTDGSKPVSGTGITMDNLTGVNAYGEQTRMEAEVR